MMEEKVEFMEGRLVGNGAGNQVDQAVVQNRGRSSHSGKPNNPVTDSPGLLGLTHVLGGVALALGVHRLSLVLSGSASSSSSLLDLLS